MANLQKEKDAVNINETNRLYEIREKSLMFNRLNCRYCFILQHLSQIKG